MPKTTLARKKEVQIGSIQSHAGQTAPDGFLVCDGSIVNIADYPKLYEVLGTSWGYGNNDGLTFHLPDLRGRFLRGQDGTAGRDPDAGSRTAANAGGATGDNVGSVQGNSTAKNGLNVSVNNRSLTGNIDSAADVASYNQSNSGIITKSNFTARLSQSFTPGGVSYALRASVDASHDHSVGFSGDNETRPTNANVNYIIRVV